MSSPFHLTYASHPSFPVPRAGSTNPLHISILDSSFNPPHLAHLSLALSTPNPPPPATLLVLSTKNVDKVQKAGEPTPEDRLEMMEAMAEELESRGVVNVGVARINEPTFVGKSEVLKLALEERAGGASVQLSFLLGWDTLIRFFDEKYYQPPAPSMKSALSTFFIKDGSRLACARRGDVSLEEEERFLAKEGVKEWRRHVKMFDVGQEVRGLSSTEVRKRVARGGDQLNGLVLESVKRIIDQKGFYREL
ncbi:nicotinamide-nucleotide adenylyltransferase, partial [Phenoliferia sp. Uapishka_3]